VMLDAVTGAFSYSGAAIARDLRAAGHRVRTLTGHPPAAPGDIEVRPLDFSDQDELARSLDGVHTLYNTYWVRFSRGRNTHAQAVANSRVLFDAARQAGVKRVVHVSITHADPSSPFPYFAGKAAVEQHLRNTGIPYVILRPAILFGGGDVLVNNIAWLLRHLPVFAIGGEGEYRIRPIHVDDLARLAVGSGTVGGGTVGGDTENATVDAVGPESVTFREMVSAVRAATGSHAAIVRVPGWAVPPLAGALGLALRDVLLTAQEYRAMASGLADSTAPSVGQVVFTDWVASHGAMLGRHYASELNRHFRPV